MKNRYIPAFIMLVAGLVCCVLCVVQRWPVLNSLITLVIVLLFLYHWADCGADCWKSAGRASGYD